VREGRADAGIVYRSDVAGQNAGYLVPLEDSPRIVYPAAAMKGGRIPFAQRFIAFLRSRRAQDIFASAGFRPLDAH
jgi:molybdate transport system substrate-binding protein